MQRRRIRHDAPLDQRLMREAQRLREQAKGTPPGIENEKLIRRARQRKPPPFRAVRTDATAKPFASIYAAAFLF